jgi:hydrogenase nickel incorporation protein HypA/HybF
MHEYSLVEALIGRVEAEVRRRGALKVHGLSVRVGELAGVDPELFQTAYDTFRAGTVCAEAPLTMKKIAAGWACPGCRQAIPRGAVLHCPACDLPAKLDEGSDALTLDGIDLEVP